MVSDDDFKEALSILLERQLDLTEIVTAIGTALQKRGVISPQDLLDAVAQVKARPSVQELRKKIRAASPSTLLELLRNFEGPLQ